MSAAIALMFLAEAATTCPPADPRLRAGASVVQAIVSVETKAFPPAAPTPAASADEQQPPEPIVEQDSSGEGQGEPCAPPPLPSA